MYKYLNRIKRGEGFTLIELMIVVAIIGILAAIAVPNFIKWTCKSRQKECANMLDNIAKLMNGYYNDDSEHPDRPETYLNAELDKIGVVWSTGRRYTYDMGSTPGINVSDKNNNADLSGALASCTSGSATAGIDATAGRSFTVICCGNIDNDSTLDVWWTESIEGETNKSQLQTAETDDCDD